MTSDLLPPLPFARAGAHPWPSAPWRIAIGASAVYPVPTSDGRRVALWHYPARSSSAQHPVILCPGLASNRHAFDLGPDRSLARWLAARGFDTWVLELRGHGASWRPPWWAPRSYRWTLDDYLHFDVPAAIATVRRRSGAAAVHWIGHSMGGILLYAHLATVAEPGLRSGMTIGSALDYADHPSDFHALRRARAVLSAIRRVPIGTLALALTPLAGRGLTPSDRFNANPANLEPVLFRRLQALAFHDVPAPLLAQLATAFEPGGLRSADGRTRYLEGLVRAQLPVLALAGVADRQCDPAAVAATIERLPSGRMLAFGRAHGHAEDYGHFDLLLGPRAESEVFAAIETHLRTHDAP